MLAIESNIEAFSLTRSSPVHAIVWFYSQIGVLDLGGWILDWILDGWSFDFGFWILDFDGFCMIL